MPEKRDWPAYWRADKMRREEHQKMLDSLPSYHERMVIHCPLHNRDGTPIADDDVKGCGGTYLTWDGEVYDCHDCGIFFACYAAEPPHNRPSDKENADG